MVQSEPLADRKVEVVGHGTQWRDGRQQQELVSDTSGGIRFFPDGSSTGGNIAVVLGEREWRINVGWLTGEITLDETESKR